VPAKALRTSLATDPSSPASGSLGQDADHVDRVEPEQGRTTMLRKIGEAVSGFRLTMIPARMPAG